MKGARTSCAKARTARGDAAGGEGVTLELSGRAALALCFVSPAATAVETTGDVSEVRQERLDGGLSLALRLDGRARVEARYADISAGSSYL